MANFFLSVLCVKTGEVGGELLKCFEKWYKRWLRLLTMLLPGRIYNALGPWHFGDFRNILLPNKGEDQKIKSYNFSSGPRAGTQALSQKFAMGAVWGSGAGPSVA